jgi:hypothetical protein
MRLLGRCTSFPINSSSSFSAICRKITPFPAAWEAPAEEHTNLPMRIPQHLRHHLTMHIPRHLTVAEHLQPAACSLQHHTQPSCLRLSRAVLSPQRFSGTATQPESTSVN